MITTDNRFHDLQFSIHYSVQTNQDLLQVSTVHTTIVHILGLVFAYFNVLYEDLLKIKLGHMEKHFIFPKAFNILTIHIKLLLTKINVVDKIYKKYIFYYASAYTIKIIFNAFRIISVFLELLTFKFFHHIFLLSFPGTPEVSFGSLSVFLCSVLCCQPLCLQELTEPLSYSPEFFLDLLAG
ncbi:hypothetical protein AGLY_005193 [Aphis glycines]|uniref:Uncharacterized protein n=1 Tax=Aphis glycines TaxID=307491 RepID=A0A6G0TW71_APHGL|nr:hypothetical protein AGLY_005193 [Aphis glycines]